MEENTKKGLIIGGSIAAVVLLGSAVGLGIYFGTRDKIENTISNNDKGIGAFSNLESFTNDGFNNGVLTSSQEYLKHYEDNAKYNSFEGRKELDQKVSHYSDDGHEYVDMLIEYYDSNDILISAGFQVANAIAGVQVDNPYGDPSFDGVFTDENGNDTEFANSADKAFVLLDDSYLSTLYDNAASISFAAEGAGYLSGYAAALYTVYDATTNSILNPNIVMWGGMPFPTVYDFMSGFAQAIEEANAGFASSTPITLWSGGDSTNNTPVAENSYVTAADNTNADTWYTWGFDASAETEDGALASVKTENALAAEASIVFPVAGGNTAIAEQMIGTAATASGTTTRLVGVDADATMSSTRDELYIGTAQKNLTQGGQLALWAMDDFDGDGIRNYRDDVDAEDTYGAEITATDGALTTWDITATEPGVQLRGTIENGGVAFQFGSQTSAGMNEDLLAAINAVAGTTTAEEAEAWLNEQLDALAGATIEAADPQLIPEDWT